MGFLCLCRTFKVWVGTKFFISPRLQPPIRPLAGCGRRTRPWGTSPPSRLSWCRSWSPSYRRTRWKRRRKALPHPLVDLGQARSSWPFCQPSSATWYWARPFWRHCPPSLSPSPASVNTLGGEVFLSFSLYQSLSRSISLYLSHGHWIMPFNV